MSLCGYNVLPINRTEREMHKDIEVTKMHNAYMELGEKVMDLLADHQKQHGTRYAAYALGQLAITLASRQVVSIYAIAPESKVKDCISEFLGAINDQAEQIMSVAVEEGLMKGPTQ